MSKILIVTNDDWCRVYLDGEIISNDHSIRSDNILKSLVGKTLDEYKSIYLSDIAEDYYEEFVEKIQLEYFKN